MMSIILSRKICSKCLKVKSIDEFYKQKDCIGEHRPDCKECVKAHRRKNYLDNPQKVIENIRVYRDKNRKKVSASVKKYQEKHKDEIRDYKKSYYLKNLDKIKESFHKAYLNKLGEYKARVKRWIGENPEKKAEYERNRYARKKGSNGTITNEEWSSMKEKYNYTCLCCRRREPEIKLTLDHIKSLKLGGTHTIDNIQPLCISCNASKSTKYIDYR